MIETTTTVAITCDKCGRAIAEGETWYQVTQAIASSVFTGTAAELSQVSELTLQLCTDDYPTWEKAGEEATPTAERVDAPPRGKPPTPPGLG